MEWNARLSTGNDRIDDQHKAVLRQLDELDAATREGRTMLAVYVLSQLNSYTREHFSTEEALMRAAGFPHLDRHIAEHEVFRARIKTLLEQAIFDEITMEVVETVKTWLIDHINGSDMEYVPYLKQMVEGAPAKRR